MILVNDLLSSSKVLHFSSLNFVRISKQLCSSFLGLLLQPLTQFFLQSTLWDLDCFNNYHPIATVCHLDSVKQFFIVGFKTVGYLMGFDKVDKHAALKARVVGAEEMDMRNGGWP